MTEVTEKRRTHFRRPVPEVEAAPPSTAVDELTAPPPADHQLQLSWMSPGRLVLEGNIRHDAQYDDILESVREDGILEPVIVEARADEYVVIDGQRRVLAAVEAGITTIPVLVKMPATDTADTVAEQLKRNELRAELTDSDRATALQTLAGLGLTADQIVRKTKQPRPRVDAALRINGDPMITDLMTATPTLTLTQAAALAEVSEAASGEDGAELVERLATTAVEAPGQLEHELQLARQQLAEQRQRDDVEADLARQGWRIVDEDEFQPAVEVHDLKTAAGAEVTDAEALACGDDAVATVHESSSWDNGWKVEFTGWCGVIDPEKHGLTPPNYATKAARDDAMTRQAEKDAKRRETLKQDRSDKREWVAASTVRDRYLRELLQRKNVPGAATVIALHACGDWPEPHSIDSPQRLARDLLGIPTGLFSTVSLGGSTSTDYAYRSLHPETEHLTRRPADAQKVALAHALAQMETYASFDRSSAVKPWRDPHSWLGPYLSWLQQTGYGLAPIEQRIVKADLKRLRGKKFPMPLTSGHEDDVEE